MPSDDSMRDLMERLIARLDVHLTQTGAQIERGNELMSGNTAALERNQHAFERNEHAFERNTRAFERNTRVYDQSIRAWSATTNGDGQPQPFDRGSAGVARRPPR